MLKKIYYILIVLMSVVFITTSQAQTTVTINCTGSAGSFNSGSVNSSGTKNDDNMITINSGENRGWARFDLSSIPIGSVISAVTANFTTYTSTTSSATNNLYGFVGNPSSMAGADLYNACATTPSLNASSWTANALNSKVLNASGLTFIQNNVGSFVNIGYVRGSTNTYNIYGYGNASRPSLTITYTPPVPCSGAPAPGNTLSSTNPSCGGISFTLSLSGSFSGISGITYQWQTSTDGITYNDISGATSATYTLSQSTSNYYQCVVTCTGGSSSTSTPLLINHNSAFMTCYCTPSYSSGSCASDYITSVLLGSLSDNTLTCLASPSYTDRSTLQTGGTPTLSIPDLEQGTTKTLTLTFGTDGTQYSGAWIDYNQNGVFESSEYSTTGLNAGASGTSNITLSIPISAIVGNTKMRIRGGDDSQNTSSQACGASNSAWGIGIDYIVNISATNNCSGTPNPGNTISSANPACNNVNFTLSTQFSTSGLGVIYQWQTSVDGISWNNISGANLSTLVTSQTTNNYYQCIVTCTISGNSATSTPILVTNNFLNCYCLPTYSSGCSNDNLASVTLGTLSDAGLTCTPIYEDRSALQTGGSPTLQIPTILPTVASTLTLTFGSDANQYNGVWIDFNRNGVFETAEYFTSNTNAGASGTANININIPIGVSISGITKMRIRGGDDSQNTSSQACGAATSSWGTARDYLVNILPDPTCFPPTALTVNGITQTTADLRWTHPTLGTPTQYQYKVVAIGQPASSTEVTSGIRNYPTFNATATGLSAGTRYSYYVRSICSIGDTSAWSSRFDFCTQIAPIAINTSSPPVCYNYDTETVPQLPIGWFPLNFNYDNSFWRSFTGLGGVTPPSAPNIAGVSANATNIMDDWLFTPSFNLVGNGIQKYKVSFRVAGGNNTNPGKIRLMVGNGTSQDIGSMNSVMWQDENLTTVSTFQNISTYFTPTINGDYTFAFRAYSGTNSYGILIDNFCIEPVTTTCSEPSNITLVDKTGTSATVSWTSPNANPNGDNEFNVEIGPVGFTPFASPSQATAAVYSYIGTTYTFTGLLPATDYQIYVNEYCDPNANPLLSANAGPVTFKTLRLNDKCATATSVALNTTINVTSGYEGNPSVPVCTDAGVGGIYTDVWHSFVAPSNGNKIVINTTAGGVATGDNDWVMEIYEGCGASAIACSDDQSGTNFMPRIELCQFEYVAGQTYYIRLLPYVFNNALTCTFTITETTPCATPPLNNDCSNAVTIPSCTSPASGTTLLATESAGIPAPTCDPYIQKNDVWYTFNSGSMLSATINITGISGTIEYAVYKGICSGLLFQSGNCGIATNGGIGTNFNVNGLEENQNYFIRVWSNPTAEGDFTICMSDNTSTQVVSNGTPNSCTTATSVNISSASYNNNRWVPITDASGNIIASLNANGQNLGNVLCKVYINTGSIRVANGMEYVDRNIEITPQTQPTFPVSVRLYLKPIELTNYINANDSDANDANTISDLYITKIPTQTCIGTYTGTPFNVVYAQTGNGTLNSDLWIGLDVSSFSSFYLHGSNDVLPIELTRFAGFNKGEINVLEWITSQEINNDKFILERSSDNLHYANIATINSKAVNGNSAQLLNYNYKDEKPYLGRNYYRLRQVDKDGQSYTSKTILLNVKGKSIKIAQAIPNPTGGHIALQILSNEDNDISISIIDNVGKVISSEMKSTVNGLNTIDTDLTGFANGSYLVRVQNVHNGDTDIIKIIKQ